MNSLLLKLRRPSRTDGVLIAAAAGMLLLAALFLYQNVQASKDVDDLSTRVARANTNLRAARNNGKVDEVKAQKQALENDLASLKPPAFDGAQVMLDLWTWAHEHSVAINSSALTKYDKTLGEQAYEVSNIALTVSGGLQDLARFITAVTGASYSPVVSTLKSGYSLETGAWVMDLELLLYRDAEGTAVETTATS